MFMSANGTDYSLTINPKALIDINPNNDIKSTKKIFIFILYNLFLNQ